MFLGVDAVVSISTCTIKLKKGRKDVRNEEMGKGYMTMRSFR
jgi:hypothetical protein